MKPLTLFFVICIMMSCKKALIGHSNETPVYNYYDSSINHPKGYAFRQLIEKYQKKGLPGISLLVHDSHGTWAGGTGESDIENHVPFGEAQVSKAASITKLFMGTLMFKLIEDSVRSGLNYQSLFEPLSKWLPESIISKLPNGNLITLGDCMKHETGIPDIIEQNEFYLAVLNQPNKNWEPEELLSFIYNKLPVFSPEDTAIYSNTNTILVTMVMEAATGTKHSQLLHEYILTPLSLQNTFYSPHDPLPNYTAQGYFDLYNNNTIVNVSNLITGSGNGYGGLYSNVFDLYTFIDALLIHKTLLSQTSLDVMQTFGKPDFPNQYGYGIMKKFIDRGEDAGIGHSGRDLGYTANLFYFPNRGVTHAFFINYGTDSKSALREVFNQFQNELLDISLKN